MKKTVKVKLTVSFKDDFIPFLENNQVCNNYIVNVLKRHRGENKGESLDLIYRLLQDAGPCMWVSGMFHWSETSEGLKFWSNIDNLWRKVLRDNAGTVDFEKVGEISKSDVEELFFSRSLRGKYYKVTDLSYNRPVTEEWDCKEWKPCEFSVELREIRGIYLVLSEYPEDKVMLWHGGNSSCPRPMIKVWVPELNRAQWVFYKESGLRETE